MSSSLSIVLALLGLVFGPALFPAGWIVLGCGSAVSGLFNHSRNQSLIGVPVALGGTIHLAAIVLATADLTVLLIWPVLAGLIFITVGTETTNPVPYFMEEAWILVSLGSYAFFPEFLFWSLLLAFAARLGANLLHLYRLLGRVPRVGEILSFTTRALFLKGLKTPIDQHRVWLSCSTATSGLGM